MVYRRSARQLEPLKLCVFTEFTPGNDTRLAPLALSELSRDVRCQLQVLNLTSFPEKAATQLESPTPFIPILFPLRDSFCTKRVSWTPPESKKAKRNLLDRESNPGLLFRVSYHVMLEEQDCTHPRSLYK